MLCLIRGLPGSGKSTLAKHMIVQLTADAERRGEVVGFSHLEADQYFMRMVNGRYEYMFDAAKLKHAHEYCMTQTQRALVAPNQRNTVIVSNTFTTLKEMEPYFIIASNAGVEVNVILCQGHFGSVHNVPVETIERMKSRFQYDVSPLYKKYGMMADQTT